MIRTLVVDDDVRVADVLRAYTEKLPGFEVVAVAHRGMEALEVLRQQEIDLVLLDFYLPDISGLEVCRALHGREGKPVDVIAVTAARDVDTVAAAVTQGVVQYLIKPFSFATLRDKLERYASYREQLRSGREAEASQSTVDELFGTLRGSQLVRLPKGLSRSTCDLVVAVLRPSTCELTASEVAEAAGISRVAARRYLEYLTGQGLVVLSLRYGTRGRPEHRYRWSTGSGSMRTDG
jgi:response regulator of citrate/malate metabolism